MLVVAFVSFSLFNFVGDPINNMVGEETSDEERAELRETLGLMDPIHVQFSRFVVNASKGEFGISYQLRRPVSDLIVERLPATIELVVILPHQIWLGICLRLEMSIVLNHLNRLHL